MEIGCWKGGGIRALKEYYNDEGEFHTVNYVFGGEIISKKELFDYGIKPFEGKQEDVDFLRTIQDLYSVIIDDGSHHADAQVISFKQMFVNNLERGGLYVVEDVYGHLNNKEGEYWRRGVANSADDTIMSVLDKFTKKESMASQFITSHESDVITSLIDTVDVYDDHIIFITKKK
jgi:hypothetical protein